MPPKDKQNTLLGLLGNLLGFDVPKSMTSKEIPTLPEFGHSYMDDLIKSFEEGQKNKNQHLVGTGLGVLDMAGGVAKAGALIPAGSKQMMKFINDVKLRGKLAEGAKKSSDKFVDALKKMKEPGSKELIAKHSQRGKEIQDVKGELQLIEHWLKFFGTKDATKLGKTQARLIEFLKK